MRTRHGIHPLRALPLVLVLAPTGCIHTVPMGDIIPELQRCMRDLHAATTCEAATDVVKTLLEVHRSSQAATSSPNTTNPELQEIVR